MELYIIFLFLVWIVITAWLQSRYRPIDTVIAGTDKYMPACRHQIPHDAKLKNVHRFDAMFARTADDGELWRKGDILIINKRFNDFIKGRFYLFEHVGEYRIAKCIGSSQGLPPIFDGHETLITHEPVGLVVGSWNMITNEHQYF